MAEIGELTGAASDVVGIFGDLFGTSQSTSGSGTTKSSATSRTEEQLELDTVAIQRIIEEVLGGTQGLAQIFSSEQQAGIFDSSVAAQASGNIAAQIVGELAKLTGKRVSVSEQEGTQEQTSTQKAEDDGILSGIGDFFGF